MEKLSLILNMVFVVYIVISEMDRIKRGVELLSEYAVAFRKQLIIKHIEEETEEQEYDDDFIERCYAIGRGENDLDGHTFFGKQTEDTEDYELLLSTCIAKKDGHEEVIAYDLRGVNWNRIDFSILGGTIEQHHDVELVKSLGGTINSTRSNYAFTRIVENAARTSSITVEDTYVLTVSVKKKELCKALEIEVLNNDEVIVEVEDVVVEDDIDTTDDNYHVALLKQEIKAGVLNPEFLQLLLDVNVNKWIA